MLLIQDGGSAESGVVASPLSAAAEGPRHTELPQAGPTAGETLDALTAEAPSALQAEFTAAAVAEPSPTPGEAVPEGTLSGRIVDPGGRPVVGARVVYHADNNSVFRRRFGLRDTEVVAEPEALSDRSGHFSLTVPVVEEVAGADQEAPFFGADSARVVATHDAFAVLVHECAGPAVGESVDLGTLAMAMGSQIEGRVVDEAGRALAGATVTARSEVSDPMGRQGMMRLLGGGLVDGYTTATTAADGRFRITGVQPGPVSLSGEAEGFQVAQLDDLRTEPGLTLSAGELVLSAGASIAGWIVDSLGRPVQGAEVRVSSLARLVIRRMADVPRQQIGQEMRLRAETDAEGAFLLQGLGLGQYTVHVNADGFAAASRDNVPAGTADLSIALQKLGGLLLSVRSAVDDGMVDGARVLATPVPLDGMFMGRMGGGELDVLIGEEAVAASGIDTDPAGMYFVSGTGANGFELQIRAQGFAAATIMTPAVSPDAVVEFDVLLRPESILAGVVIDSSGQAVAGATVSLAAYVPPPAAHNGEFEMRHEISQRIGGSGESGDDWKRARSDENGAFALQGVPAGDWELKASADGFAADDPLVVSLAEGQSRHDVEVTLLLAGSIAGVVFEQDGQPVKGAQVMVTPVESGGSTPTDPLAARLASMMGGGDARRAHSDAEGSFAVPDLLPGLYEVKLVQQRGMRMGRAMMIIMDGSDGGAEQGQRIEVRAREAAWVELIRPPTSSLSGRVLAGGRPVSGVTVELTQASSFLPFGGRPAETDSTGRYLFEEVEPGDYDVSVIVPGAALPEEGTIELHGGQEGRLDLVFSGSTVSGRLIDRESGQGVVGATINLTSDAVLTEAGPGAVAVSMSFVSAGSGGAGSSMTMDLGGGDLSKVRTDRNGNFRIDWVKPGNYGIETEGGGYISAQDGPFDVEEGQNLDDFVIKADRGASLAGRVVSGQSGQLLDAVPVQLQPLGGGDSEMTTTTEGSYSFDGLVAGEYMVSVMGSGFGSAPLASDSITLTKGELHTLDLTTTAEAVAPSNGSGMTITVGAPGGQ